MTEEMLACLNCQATDCDPNQCALLGNIPKEDRIVDGRAWRVYSRIPPITVNGETHNLREWAEINGLSYMTVYMRIARGMAPEQAVMLPKQPKGRKKKPRKRKIR